MYYRAVECFRDTDEEDDGFVRSLSQRIYPLHANRMSLR
eukprot:gene17812-23212_t